VRSGDGTLAIDGRIIPADPIPALVTIRGESVRFANTPTLMVIASPDLELKLTEGRWNLDGAIAVPRARIDASKIEAGAEASPDVVVVDDAAAGEPARPWRARVRVTLGDDVRLEGFGFTGTVAGALDIRQRQGAQALATGEITLAGRYEAYGQRLDITRGGLRYANSPLAEPAVDLRAERKVRDQTVALEVTGSALAPQSRIVGGSGSDSDALALLVTGRPLAEIGIGDRDRLGDAATALGAVGSDLLTRQLRGRLGLDELGVSNDTRLDGEAFTLGKFLSPRLYVGYGIGVVTRGEIFTVRYLVTDRLDIEASSGDSERAALNWRLER
jgi:translocation and assembly module TamB